MTSPAEAARRYAEHGWCVVPLHSVREDGSCSCQAGEGCESPGKHPRIGGWRRDDPWPADQVSSWWERWPEANVGVATGRASGIVAVDVDDADSWARLEEAHGGLPDTAAIRTGRGRHLLFRCPDEGLPNSAGRLAPGVDVRGEGGLIVAPPSRHHSGAVYEWASLAAPAPLPGWVPETLTVSDRDAQDRVDGTAYGRAVLDGETAKVVQAREGGRNDTLFSSAVRVFEVVKAEHLDRGGARDALMAAGRGCGLEAWEITRTLESAWQRAEAKPPEEREGRSDPNHSPVGALLTVDDLRSMPSPRWLIEGMLPEGLTVLYGQHGTGKTFLALDMALTVASQGGLVVYCAGEGVSGLSSRVDAWIKQRPDLDPTDGFRALTGGAFPNLLRESSVTSFTAALDGLARAGTAVDLVVVDTWRLALSGHTVNDDEVSMRALSVLQGLRNRWGTSSMIVHHSRKPARDDPNPPEAGSGALSDSVDCVWKCVEYPESTERVVYNKKLKEWGERDPLRFTLREAGDSLVVSPSASEMVVSP